MYLKKCLIIRLLLCFIFFIFLTGCEVGAESDNLPLGDYGPAWKLSTFYVAFGSLPILYIGK